MIKERKDRNYSSSLPLSCNWKALQNYLRHRFAVRRPDLHLWYWCACERAANGRCWPLLWDRRRCCQDRRRRRRQLPRRAVDSPDRRGPRRRALLHHHHCCCQRCRHSREYSSCGRPTAMRTMMCDWRCEQRQRPRQRRCYGRRQLLRPPHWHSPRAGVSGCRESVSCPRHSRTPIERPMTNINPDWTAIIAGIVKKTLIKIIYWFSQQILLYYIYINGCVCVSLYWCVCILVSMKQFHFSMQNSVGNLSLKCQMWSDLSPFRLLFQLKGKCLGVKVDDFPQPTFS